MLTLIVFYIFSVFYIDLFNWEFLLVVSRAEWGWLESAQFPLGYLVRNSRGGWG
jgi:hypothetical protein